MLPPSVVELEGPWRHEFLHTRGLRLHAAVAGPATGPLVLCIHGSVGGWFDYKRALPLLADAGYRVAALDLRGYGLSDKPPVEPGQDMRTLTGDIAGVIKALGAERAILVGNDTGAALAWSVASEKPDMVTAVVSISGAHPADIRRSIATRPWNFGWFLFRAFASRLPIPLLNRLPRPFLVRWDLALNAEKPVPWLLKLRTQAIEIGSTLRGSVSNHRLLTTPLPRPKDNGRVSAPVLFIHANQRLWRPVIRLAATRAPQLESVYIPGTKNLPHAEAPAIFCETVTEWLDHPQIGATINIQDSK